LSAVMSMIDPTYPAKALSPSIRGGDSMVEDPSVRAVPATQPIVDHERPPFGHRGPTELQGEVSVETGMVCVSTYRRGFAAPPR